MTIGLQAYLQGYMHDKTAARKPGAKITPITTNLPAPTGKERIAARDEYLKRNRINNRTENLATTEKFPGWGFGHDAGWASEARLKYDRAKLYRDPKRLAKLKGSTGISAVNLPGYREGGVPSLETRTTAGLEQPRNWGGGPQDTRDREQMARDNPTGWLTSEDVERMYPQK